MLRAGLGKLSKQTFSKNYKTYHRSVRLFISSYINHFWTNLKIGLSRVICGYIQLYLVISDNFWLSLATYIYLCLPLAILSCQGLYTAILVFLGLCLIIPGIILLSQAVVGYLSLSGFFLDCNCIVPGLPLKYPWIILGLSLDYYRSIPWYSKDYL